jgi:hypothetical protein
MAEAKTSVARSWRPPERANQVEGDGLKEHLQDEPRPRQTSRSPSKKASAPSRFLSSRR